MLTHGHFDRVGAVEDLAARWDVPAWAHADEAPYLNGSASYPPPDPGVGGLRAAASPLFPRAPVSRYTDSSMIAGDAFITTAQEEASAVATQAAELHGPPRYFTHDWEAAARSVRTLAALDPEIAVTGHGLPAGGPGLRDAPGLLATHFERVAVPVGGRYVGHPQRAEDGSAYRPA